MKQHWIVINKSGMRNIIFDFEIAKEYIKKGYKVIFVAAEKGETK